MLLFVVFLFFILCVAIFSNAQRKKRALKYALIPNCLLTRWPVLFVTGKRSLFYFSSYWNIFPEFLTEHGYEVYTLRLPWSGPIRTEKLCEFLQEHSAKARRYHLIMDLPTYQEFTPVWATSYSCIMSLNEIQSLLTEKSSLGACNRFSYFLHRLKLWPLSAPSPHSLGVSPEASLRNAQLLLQRVSQLAEEDVVKD